MSMPEPSTICCYRPEFGCRTEAVIHMFCKVEGRDTHFCQRHWNDWSNGVRGDDSLAMHCPRCAPAYLARREAEAANPLVAVASEPITGPLADAIDRAMNAEGILSPTRMAVLKRLGADTDAYVAAVMSRSSAAMV